MDHLKTCAFLPAFGLQTITGIVTSVDFKSDQIIFAQHQY